MSEIIVVVDSAVKEKILNEYFAGRAETVICPAPPLRPVYQPASKNTAPPTFIFKELPAGQEVIAKICGYLDKEIYLALDNDSRGEYYAWLINGYIQQVAKTRIFVKRLNLAGLTHDGIAESLKWLSAVDEHKGINFYTRALFDNYLGRHLNRLIGTSNGPGNLPLNANSLGSIFSLAGRETEIKMFAPSEKWQVMADLRLAGHIFAARLKGVADLTTDGFFKELSGAEKAVELVREDPFVVDKMERDELCVAPPAPYKMVELLHDAFILCDAQLRDTLNAVHKLFYGIEVNGRTMGLISSFYDLGNSGGDDWQSSLRKQVAGMYGEKALGDGLAESIARSGMIYPLRPELGGADLAAALTPKEIKIYDLLRCRALASQMRPVTGENILVEIIAGPESLFISKFHHVTERGFMNIYQGTMDKKFTGSCPLADISLGDEATMLRLTPEKTATVSAAYTIESLLADLADFSIAVEPANILMLQDMIASGYVKVSEDGYWHPADKNIQVETIMERAFPRMRGINLSAYIEQTITEVTSGRKRLDFALKQFDQTLMGHGASLVKAAVHIPTKLRSRKRTSSHIIKQSIDESVSRAISSPTAGSDTHSGGEDITAAAPEITARVTSEAVAEAELDFSAEDIAATVDSAAADRSKEPDTRQDTWSGELQKVFEQSMVTVSGGDEQPLAVTHNSGDEKIIATEESKQCQVCGKPMQLKQDHFGKFWSCSAFPKCRHSEAYSEIDTLNMLCPLCGEAKIIHQRMPTGKTMYLCPGKDCEFMAWARPYNIPCQICDSPYLVQKKYPNGTVELRCPKAGCNYKLPLPDSGNAAVPTASEAPKKKKVRVRRVPRGTGKKGRVVRRRK